MCINCIIPHNISKKYLKILLPIFREALKELYEQSMQPAQLNPKLLRAIADEIWEGVGVGFDTNYDAHAPGSDHYRMIEELEKNVYVFSGFKTYQQLREASLLMKDDEGNLKSFTQFFKDVRAINETYNVNYLRAEYDNAVVSAQMVTKWQDVQARKATGKYLKFVATIDDRTTALCHQLNGMVRPVDDPVWKRYWLPLHWGERSDIVQVVDATEEELAKGFNLPKLSPMFNGNVGIEGVIFPDTHPYFDTPELITKQVTKNAIALVPKHKKNA